MLLITDRPMLLRVAGSSPAMSFPAIVASMDCELSRITSTLGLTGVVRNKGTVANVSGAAHRSVWKVIAVLALYSTVAMTQFVVVRVICRPMLSPES